MAEVKEKKKKHKPRRFNGTGSIWKLPGRRRNPWLARISPETDEEGKPIYIYSYHETAYDADKSISKMEAEYWESKNRNPLKDDTVAQVWERFKSRKFPKLDEDTAKGYGYSYAHWSDIYDRRIGDLLTSDLQVILDRKAGMSHSSLSKMRSLMVALFNLAATDDIVKRNYASLLELPRKAPTEERRSFTDEELQKIKAAAFGENGNGPVPYADVVLLMCFMGWRPTEMCELTSSSVDTAQWFITGGIKTEAGKGRRVPVHSLIRPIVTDWMQKGHGRLIANEQGEPLTKDTWRTRYYSVMKAVFGDKTAVPNTTRHTCASMLHAAGADYLSIARIMGHKDYKITARTYTHVQLKELKAAIDSLGAEP